MKIGRTLWISSEEASIRSEQMPSAQTPAGMGSRRSEKSPVKATRSGASASAAPAGRCTTRVPSMQPVDVHQAVSCFLHHDVAEAS